jgi:4-hydroxybenzoate polyprenyltransferase
MKRIFIISAGIVGILVGMGFVMPAIAQYRDAGTMTHGEPWLFLLGSLLTLTGVGAGIFGAKKRNA